MLRYTTVLGAVLALFLTAPSAWAQEPTAMVEDATGVDGIQTMDFLYPGDTVDLGDGGTMTVGYFASCAQETIAGGTVTIGEFESTVDGGSVDTAYIDCDDQVLSLAEGQEQEAGTAVFRPGDPCTSLVPDLVVYDVSPLVRLSTGDAVSYVPACEASSAEWTKVSAPNGRADFRAADRSLIPGETYLLRAGDKTLTLLVSKLATANSPSLLSRFVPL